MLDEVWHLPQSTLSSQQVAIRKLTLPRIMSHIQLGYIPHLLLSFSAALSSHHLSIPGTSHPISINTSSLPINHFSSSTTSLSGSSLPDFNGYRFKMTSSPGFNRFKTKPVGRATLPTAGRIRAASMTTATLRLEVRFEMDGLWIFKCRFSGKGVWRRCVRDGLNQEITPERGGHAYDLWVDVLRRADRGVIRD